MNTIFLSYSSQDYFFAEMLALKLAANGFAIWRDLGSIRAGDDWRQTIEDGIKGCFAVVVALSANSANSAYVTYEWAYAMGMEKPVIPVKLSDCSIHPKLEPTQYIDFSYPRALPWDDLIQRLKDVEAEPDPTMPLTTTSPVVPPTSGGLDDPVNAILAYLNKRGYTMASFERLRTNLKLTLTDQEFDALVTSHPRLFRKALLKDAKPGIAKRVP